MPLTSIITVYDPDWPRQYDVERRKLSPIFGEVLVEIHHVGSTAIQELAAKPEIDILVVVANTTMAERWTIALLKLGYQRGKDLSPEHLFYKRDAGGIRSHKIHVCEQSHQKINEMLMFRNYLRSNSDARDQYQQFKLELEQKNSKGIAEYLAAKEPFIRHILTKATSE